MKGITALLAPLFFSACVNAVVGTADAGTLVDLSVTERSSGQKLEVYRHHGRYYVAGTPGNRYAINLHNKSDGRVLTVVSVDGVNALNGQTAAASQSGYVLAPWQQAEIAGWRKNMDEVAAFYFTSVADSYAARTDRPQNVGVIGIAVYRELPPPAPPAALEAREEAAGRSAAPAPAAKSGAMSQRADAQLGTGHGERINAPTQYTDFKRASQSPSEIITIYYNSRANLVAQGVIPASPRYSTPNPFPGAFVPDPRS